MGSRSVDEYLVSVPKHNLKKYNVMRFNSGDNVDIRKWVNASLTRDMSAKKIYEEEDAFPEFGEGSEYGRKQKEEARRLKYGIKRSKFKEEDQPWNLSVTTVDTQTDMKKKVNGKSDVKPKLITKEYSGKKEGGIGEGSMYFIFTQRPDFTFEAHPVEDWFNFRRKIQHRTLTDEEAEAAWDKRDKIVNHLNYMARKRLHINDEEEGGEDVSVKSESASISKEKNSNLMIHDNEDYELYMSDSSSDEEEKGDNDANKAKKKKKSTKPKADDSGDEKNEAVEDSDDGEHEGTEIAYASDVSSENEEINDSKVVPRGLDELTSSSSSEDEEEIKDKTDQNNDDTKISKQSKGSDDSASSGESDSDIDDEDSLSKSALFMQKKKVLSQEKKSSKRGGSHSRSPTPSKEASGSGSVSSKLQAVPKALEAHRSQTVRQSPGGSSLGKRSAVNTNDDSAIKKQKFSHSGSGASTPTKELSSQGITEEAVRRYLTHKPITTKDLLKKFKTKKTRLSSEQIVEKVAKILKKLNPQQSKINGRMHLFLKAT